MDTRYYSVPEVNALLPRVREAFGRVMQLRAQLKPIYHRLELADAAPDRSDFDIELPGASREVTRDRAAFKGMVEMLNEELAAVADLGGTIKDLDTGLVDWLARRNGQEILLCWRLGETEIGYWHDLETGVAGRRPVEELVGTEATRTPPSLSPPSSSPSSRS